MHHIQGLTAAEVAEKTRAGLVNDYDPKSTKSVLKILLTNIFIVFNVMLAPLLATLVALGQYKDVFSVGGIALLNTVINIFQEIRAKIALDRIKMENPPIALVIRDGRTVEVPTRTVVQGDALVLKSGELALADGPVAWSNNLEMDESMLTGESDYVPKPAQAAVLSGSFAVAGEGVYVAEKIGAECYMQKVVSQSRVHVSKTTPLEKKIGLLVNVFMVCCFVIAGVLLLVYKPTATTMVEPVRFIVASVTSMIPQGLVLIVTVAFALGVIAFAKRGIIFQKMNAVEALSNVDLICMDKTGTLTSNRIDLEELRAMEGVDRDTLAVDLGDFARFTSEKNKTMEAVAAALVGSGAQGKPVDEVPFKSRNKYSAMRIENRCETFDLVVGAYETVAPLLVRHDQAAVRAIVNETEAQGMRTMVVGRKTAAHGPLKDHLERFHLAGVLSFREQIKPEAPEILKGFADQGVRQVVISGDSLVTVQAIARRIGLAGVEAGVTGAELLTLPGNVFRERVLATTVFARVAPEQKREIIKVFKEAGLFVAMVGDGVNDVLALKEANLAIAMGSGGSMAKDVSDIVLVNNRFDVLPGLLMEGDRIVSRIQDCARIFTLKNFYALFMIVAILGLGITFPFFPQQITLINLVTITIPLLYLVKFSTYTAKVEKHFLPDIVRFSATFGSLIAVTALGLNYLYTDVFLNARNHVQTAAMVPVVVLAQLSFLYLLNRARHPWEIFGDRIMAPVMVLLTGVFFAGLYIEPLRSFFEVVALDLRDWVTIGIFVVPAMFVHWLLMWRYMSRTQRAG